MGKGEAGVFCDSSSEGRRDARLGVGRVLSCPVWLGALASEVGGFGDDALGSGKNIVELRVYIVYILNVV